MLQNIDRAFIDEFVGKILPAKAQRRNYDSSLRELYTFQYTPIQIQQSLQKFYYNGGVAQDGASLRINEYGRYVRFTTSIDLLDERETSVLSRVEERSRIERPSVLIYLNGKKVPDKFAYVYPGQGFVEIFIPDSFVSLTGTNELFVEKRLFLKEQYESAYFPTADGTSLSFDLDEEVNLLKKQICVFVDGYYTSRNFSLSRSGTHVILSFDTSFSGNSVEIFIDGAIQYVKSASWSMESKAIFGIDESYYDALHGPVSKNSCFFFIDGKRIPNNQVETLGRMHFGMNVGSAHDFTTSVVVTDLGNIDDSQSVLYGDDYYLYNFLGVDKLTQGLLGKPTVSAFDGLVNLASILNDTKMYDAEFFRTFLNALRQTTQIPWKLQYILETYPASIRPFLEFFGKKKRSYNISYASEPRIYIPIKRDKKYNTAMIAVNGRHVLAEELDRIERGDTDSIGIPGDYFNVGFNAIDSVEFSSNSNGPQNQKFNPGDFLYDNATTRYYKIVNFLDVNDVTDIVVLKKIESDANYVYTALSGQKGYIVADTALTEILPNGSVKVSFPTIPTSKIMIYCKRFVFTYTTTFTTDIDTLEEMIIPIVTGTNDEPIPVIPSGNIYVYLDDQLVLETTDYVYQHQLKNSSITFSGIVIKRVIPNGTKIDVYFSEPRNKVLLTIPEVLADQNYGLVYLTGLPFPFSPKYMNIFANEKQIPPSHIDVLSDKLIRIHSETVPLFDLQVISDFSVDITDLESYYANYVPSAFENLIKQIFKKVDYSYHPTIGEIVPDTTTIYAGFVSTVDSVNKALSTQATPSPSPRYNLILEAFLRWLKSPSSKLIIDGSQPLLPAAIRVIEIYGEPPIGNVVIDGSTKSLLSTISLSLGNYPLNEEAAAVFARFWRDSGLPQDEVMAAYIANKTLSNATLYEKDIPAIDGSGDYDGENIILGYDPNVGVPNQGTNVSGFESSTQFLIDNTGTGFTGQINNFIVSSDGAIFGLSADAPGKLLKSTDFGIHYTLLPLSIPEDDTIGYSILYANQELFVFGKKRIYRLRDDGSVVEIINPVNYGLDSQGAPKDIIVRENQWFGIADTVFLVSNDKGKTWVKRSTESGLPIGGHFKCIVADPDGSRIWVGTDLGAFESQDGGYKFAPRGSGIHLTGEILSLAYSPSDNKLYIGTKIGGVFSTSDMIAFANFTVANSNLTSNKINTLATDHDGRLFVGTDQGMSFTKDKISWSNFTTTQGLRSNLVTKLRLDRGGALYAGTSYGISVSENILDYDAFYDRPASGIVGEQMNEDGPYVFFPRKRVEL